jgi:hypothetical protein
MKLAIATPFYSMSGFAPYIRSLADTLRKLSALGVPWECLMECGDSYVDRARNTLCARFLRSNCTHLLFIDSDMGWDEQGLINILNSPFELTGAAYPMKNAFDKFVEGTVFDTDHAPVQDEKTGLIEASIVPAGFMLIARSCLEKLITADPENKYNTLDDGKEICVYNFFENVVDKEKKIRFGEDISFCNKWTALGNKIYIEPRINFVHCGMMAWPGNYNEHLLRACEKERINRAFRNVEKVLI